MCTRPRRQKACWCSFRLSLHFGACPFFPRLGTQRSASFAGLRSSSGWFSNLLWWSHWLWRQWFWIVLLIVGLLQEIIWNISIIVNICIVVAIVSGSRRDISSLDWEWLQWRRSHLYCLISGCLLVLLWCRWEQFHLLMSSVIVLVTALSSAMTIDVFGSILMVVVFIMSSDERLLLKTMIWKRGPVGPVAIMIVLVGGCSSESLHKLVAWE